MNSLFRKLWRDEAGFVVSTELVLIATIVVIGLVAGLSTVRDQVVTELADVADAISALDQSYSWGAITAHCGSVSGSIFNDEEDFCDTGADGAQGVANGAGTCITICSPATSE
jgi:Flp pilus assembly pilin Flp